MTEENGKGNSNDKDARKTADKDREENTAKVNLDDVEANEATEIISIGEEPVKTTPKSDNSSLEEALTKAQNDYLYLRADFDNYRKGVIKERAELIRYGSERVFVELLNVLDTFERALTVEITPETVDNFKEGIVLTANELKRTLENFGLKELPSDGVPFDPNIHEALSSEPTDSVPPGHITQVFKKPYKLHDRVIRHGQVVVAKAPENG